MIALLHRFIIPAAYSILPAQMADNRATALMLAIFLQESGGLQHRLQVRGPARGFPQFERGSSAGGGVVGVLRHARSKIPIANACDALRVRPTADACYEAIAHNDVLAVCFARCLLWTHPEALPGPQDADRAWDQYLECWRPGKPRHATWNAYYMQAWATVLGLSSVSEDSMMYVPRYNHLRDQILDIAAGVQDDFPDDWDAVEHKDDAFIRRVAWACKQAGLAMVGLNGKRGNTNDLSTDVLAFAPNATGCGDASGTYPGLELHDIIHASDSPQKALAWGDATQETIDGGTVGAWVEPESVDDEDPPNPDPPTIPDYEAIGGDAVFIEKIGTPLESDCAQVGQTLNAGSSVWFGRSCYDAIHDMAVNGTDPTEALDASVEKHRTEWRAVLGLPPL